MDSGRFLLYPEVKKIIFFYEPWIGLKTSGQNICVKKPPRIGGFLLLLLCPSGLSAPGSASGFISRFNLRNLNTIQGRGRENRLLPPVIVGKPNNAYLFCLNIDGLHHHVGTVGKPRNRNHIADQPLRCAYTHHIPLLYQF
jgi:hypothetical protein